MKRRQSEPVSPPPEAKKKKLETKPQSELFNKTIRNKDVAKSDISFIEESQKFFIGDFWLPLNKIHNTRKEFMIRKIDEIFVKNLEAELHNNISGLNFRKNLVVNIFSKIQIPSDSLLERIKKSVKNQQELNDFLSQEEFENSFGIEVVHGNHTISALKKIIADESVDMLIKNKIGKFQSNQHFIEFKVYCQLDVTMALEIAAKCNNASVFFKKNDFIDTIGKIAELYRNPFNLTSENSAKSDRTLKIEIKTKMVQLYFLKSTSDAFDYKPYNNRIK